MKLPMISAVLLFSFLKGSLVSGMPASPNPFEQIEPDEEGVTGVNHGNCAHNSQIHVDGTYSNCSPNNPIRVF
jgi:hypothetical protein